MKKHSDNLRIKAHAGFSLVDVMVGMVIALLGVIIMFQVFSVSEGIKRTTTSGGDALQNGASALLTLERSLKQAGYGIFASGNIAPAPSDPPTAPVSITFGAATASDTLVLTYREGWDYGPFPPNPIAFVSAVPRALTIETIAVNNQAQLVSTKAAAPAPAYAVSPSVAVPPSVISDGIVLMKAEYGADADGNGVITSNEWTRNPPAIGSVYAVRLVVVARSAQPEKPNAAGQCATTVTPPTWSDSGAVPLDLGANLGLTGLADDNWMCYRYKTFENTVPLRNR